MTTLLAQELLINGLAAAVLALSIDRRLLWGALTFAAGSFAVLAMPAFAFEAFGAVNFFAMGLIALVWRAPGNDHARS
ncbi:MAG: hypothetical protein H0U74_00150 [Bradymonadaceae bacterium]|nr:hypothetical protein [Lujinxingiaceae bacterium]